MMALEGVNVLDLSRAGPGPFCTMILGDLGAEIIRVEAPQSISGRGASIARSPIDDSKAIFQFVHRNKKSIGLDLRSDESRQIFYRLAKKADVIVEGFRPGVTNRLHIDYATINKINPRIVYCSITGYGQDGPYRDLPGHDINYISFGGVLGLIGERRGQPVVPLNLIADLGGGGMSAVVGILTALIARGKTGKGQHIDISLTDSAISLLPGVFFDGFPTDKMIRRGELALGGAYPYYNTYETKDGKFITIGCLEPWLWENLCRALEKEEFIPFSFEPGHTLQPPEGKEWEEVLSSLKQIFLTKTRDEWFDFLSQRDVPIGKVYSLDEIFTDPQLLHRKMVTQVEHPTLGKVKQLGIAIKLSDTPGEVRRSPPTLGQHTDEILAALGYSQETIKKLRQDGLVS